MNKLLASGNGWELSHEAYWNMPDKTYLRLKSKYGVVEIAAGDGSVLRALEQVQQAYEELKAQGPVLSPSKPHPDACPCDECAAIRFAFCGYED